MFKKLISFKKGIALGIVAVLISVFLGISLVRAQDALLSGGNILDAKNLTLGDTTYHDPIDGSDGDRIRFRVRVVNQGSEDAENAVVSFDLSSGVSPSVEVDADNADMVSDIVNIAPGGTSLSFVSGSGKKYGPACPSGCAVGDEISSTGVNLGNVSPGQAQSYQLSVEADIVGTGGGTDPLFRTGNIFDGGNRTDTLVDWQDPIPADPGELLEFRAQIINDGNG